VSLQFGNNTAQNVWFLIDRRSAVRSTLEAALVACTDNPWKSKARRFLRGLSCDELQYIAGFLGGCIIDPALQVDYASISEDRELKMILVKEYLCYAGGNARLATRRAD
jgi:hypothetical protein